MHPQTSSTISSHVKSFFPGGRRLQYLERKSTERELIHFFLSSILPPGADGVPGPEVRFQDSHSLSLRFHYNVYMFHLSFSPLLLTHAAASPYFLNEGTMWGGDNI